MSELKPYPEWRQLKANIEPLLQSQTKFSYDELEALSGIDIRTDRGRQHFYKFRRLALKEWKVWFENSPGFGYILIPASEQSKAAIKRVGSAKRKVKLAGAINSQVRAEQLSEAQLLLHAQTGALIADLAKAFQRTGRQLRAVASKFKLEMSEDQLNALTEAHESKKKKAPTGKPTFRIEMSEDALKAITGGQSK